MMEKDEETEKKRYKFFLITMVCWTTRLVGFWCGKSKLEFYLKYLCQAYAIFAGVVGLTTQTIDIYFRRYDFLAVADSAVTIIIVIVASSKAVDFTILEKRLNHLIEYAEDNFWNCKYNKPCYKIVSKYEKLGIFALIFFGSMITLCSTYYTYRPFIVPGFNRHGNNTRALPFNFYLPMDFFVTPIYEITYIFQAAIVFELSLCSISYDFLIITLILHMTAQFHVLSHEVETYADKYNNYIENNGYIKHEALMKETYQELKKCILKHKELIAYHEQLEYVLNKVMLIEICLPSIGMCLMGYMITVTESALLLAFNSAIISCGIIQILLYSLFCNGIIVWSGEVGNSAYKSKWYVFPQEKQGRLVRQCLVLLPLRSQKPCALTAGKFGTLSTATFTSVMSTTMSYITMLRAVNEDEE